MSWLIARSGELTRRIRTLLHRDQVARDLAEEFQLHLDLRAQQQTAQGSNPHDAQAAARRRFGNPTRLREQSYEAWGWRWLETLFQDAQYGLRGMLRSPGITLVALLSLALGIGANTALFSLIDAVMLRSLPVDHPEQLVLLGTAGERGTVSGFDVTDLFCTPFTSSFSSAIAALSAPRPWSAVIAPFTALSTDAVKQYRCRSGLSPVRISRPWASLPSLAGHSTTTTIASTNHSPSL